MARLADVVADQVIASAWGNQVRDQSVNYFTNAAQRTSTWTSPHEGAVSYLQDTDQLSYYNGSAWVTLGGPVVCTSSTRPTALYEGMLIYETDTDRLYVRRDTSWVYVAGGAQPAYSLFAQRQTAWSIPAAPTTVSLEVSSEIYDYASAFNNATYLYTAPVAGLYRVCAHLEVQANNNPDAFIFYVQKNGVTLQVGTSITARGYSTGDPISLDLNGVVSCAASDTIGCKVDHNAGGNACTVNVAVGFRPFLQIDKLP